MRPLFLTFLVLAVLALWLGSSRFINAHEMASAEDLFYVDTERSEEYLERAARRSDHDPWTPILLARLHMSRGELDGAAEDLEAASRRVSDNAAADRLVILNEIGKLDLLRGDPDAALQNFAASLEIVEGLIAQPGGQSAWAEDQAIGTLNMSRALKAMGEYEEALGWAERSLEQRRSLGGLPAPDASRPLVASTIRMEAVALSDIASIYSSLGRREDALSAYEAAHLVYMRANRFDESGVQALYDAAGVLRSIASLNVEAGDVSRAADGYLDALAHYTAVHEANPRYPSASDRRSDVSYALAELLAAHPELEQHQRFHDEFLDGRVARRSLDNFAIWALILDGDRHAGLGENELALEMYRRALRKAERWFAGRSGDVDYRRETWIAHLRAAELDTPRSQDHAAAAAEIMTELREAGILADSDLAFLKQAERLSN